MGESAVAEGPRDVSCRLKISWVDSVGSYVNVKLYVVSFFHFDRNRN